MPEITIQQATDKDCKKIVDIGRISVEASHRASCAAADMSAYIDSHYNEAAITQELKDPKNIYHLIYVDEQPVGFSKMVLNAEYATIPRKNIAKLDRIYLLKDFHSLKLGFQLLQFNISLAKNNHQSGIWLVTWEGNKRAIDFYLKTGFTFVGSEKFNVTETFSNVCHLMLLDFESVGV